MRTLIGQSVMAEISSCLKKANHDIIELGVANELFIETARQETVDRFLMYGWKQRHVQNREKSQPGTLLAAGIKITTRRRRKLLQRILYCKVFQSSNLVDLGVCPAAPTPSLSPSS